MLIDKRNGLEIVAHEISTNTNFNGQEITSETVLMAFAKKAMFPSHALIIRKSKEDIAHVVKGIKDFKTLKQTFDQFIKNYGIAFVETDMRAMHNPSRMQVIETATKKLLEKVNSCCPKCEMPGFSITESKQGLPCVLCGLPTRSTLSHVYKCAHCGFTEELIYPNQKKFEEPTFCHNCNP